MAFSSDDCQTAGGLDLIREFDVGTTARHVGGDGHGAGLTGFGNDFSLALVQLGVQDLVFDVSDVKHAREQFADLDRGRTHEDRSAGFAEGYDIIDDGVVLLALRFVDEVFAVLSGNGPVGRDDHHVEFVDVPQLSCFCFGRAGHARELVVHTKVILERNRSVGLGGRLHLHVFLRFNGLMQAVGVASAVHDAARLLVDNLDLVVHHHVVHVLLEQGVRLQQLIHGVDARTLDRVVGHQPALLFEFGFLVTLTAVDGHQFRRQIRHGEEVVVLHVGRQELNALLGQLHLVLLLVDDEIEIGIGFRHFTLVVGEVNRLGLEQLLLHALKTQKLDERLGLGQRAVRTEQGQSAFGNVIFRGPIPLEQALGVRQELLGCLLLDRDELNHFGLELDKFLLVALRGRSADDQRGSRFVNQHGVDLIHDGEVVLTLDQLLRALRHIVAQVVEAEFVVGAVRNVGTVSLPTGFAIGLVLVDAIDSHAVELKQWRHPLRVAAGEVIVHSDEVHAFSGQRVEEHGERGNKRLALTRLHLRHLATMQRRTAD